MMGVVALATAGPADCRACCNEAGVTPCEPALRIVGGQSLVIGSAGDWSVNGAWILECDGTASWDDTVTIPFDHPPGEGEVATADAPSAFLKCFVENCHFPDGFCPRSEGGYPALKDCEDSRTITDADLETPAEPKLFEPPAPTRVVLGAQRLPASGERVDVTPPTGPIPPCDTPEALVFESIAQVDTGNDLELDGDPAGAAGAYRAALSLDACNTSAWVALGNLALSRSEHPSAARAYDTALLLNPAHYGAAAGLGKAREALGDSAGAAEAYQQALDHRPGLPEAIDGLQRVGVAPR